MDYLKNIVIQVSVLVLLLFFRLWEFFITVRQLSECGYKLHSLHFNCPRHLIGLLHNNILLCAQYMTFPAQSSEKLSLVPVLATLLQFTPKELTSVQRCAMVEPVQTSLWSSIGLGGASSVVSSKVPKEVSACELKYFLWCCLRNNVCLRFSSIFL